MMDWTPMALYGEEISLAGPGSAAVILYPLPDLGAAGTEEFLVEDDDETQLYLERIVGDIHMGVSVSESPVAWQLMPMGVDYDTPAVLEPFTTPWSPLSSDWANLRWWDRRYYNAQIAIRPLAVDHPHWTHVDIHPRQMMGRKRELWPVLWIYAGTAVTLRVSHQLRALWKY